jgi:apolipoprotein N-acyltransferase
VLNKPWAAALAAAALGALQTLAFVHTAAWPLPLLAVAALVALLHGAAPRRAALLGWSFGTGWLCAGVWWLFISMHRYGGLPAPLAAGAVLLLASALSLYLALACAAWARWRRPGLAGALLFAALWLLAELARGVWFTGFPWVASGYALVDAPLAALAPWVGVYGMGAWLALAGAGLAQLVLSRGRQWAAAAAAGAVAVLAWAVPHGFTAPAGELKVALLQPNVKQDEKFAADRLPETLAWVARELSTARAPLVIAPETAVPLLPFQLKDFAPGYWEQLQAHFAVPGRAALVGVPLGDFDRGYTNSVVGLNDAAEPYRYDKFHLVPFGEFIPTGFRWFTEMMNIPLGDFTRGVTHPPSFAALGQRIAPNICYEDLFGEELARRFVDPARAPTLLANVSNIGWFGDTIAVAQHLHISRMRSLELQRPMLRATNTGATAVIDHEGRVTASLAPHTQGVLVAKVQGREGVTPFAAWAGRFGLLPLWIVGALGLLLLGPRFRRGPSAPGDPAVRP